MRQFLFFGIIWKYLIIFSKTNASNDKKVELIRNCEFPSPRFISPGFIIGLFGRIEKSDWSISWSNKSIECFSYSKILSNKTKFRKSFLTFENWGCHFVHHSVQFCTKVPLFNIGTWQHFWHLSGVFIQSSMG